MTDFVLRSAEERDAPIIWRILQGAIEQRRLEGSDQWQQGYPNERTVRDDIAASAAYVLTEGDAVVGCAAIILDGEPAYDAIDGAWLTHGRYATVHRVASAREPEAGESPPRSSSRRSIFALPWAYRAFAWIPISTTLRC